MVFTGLYLFPYTIKEEVLMKKQVPNRIFSLILILALLVAGVMAPATAHAASLKKSKPKFTAESAYLNDTVYLTWKKVKGAKKYEIQRAKVSKKGKTGKWKKWKTVRKNYIKKAAKGDYRYRVRAIKGSTKSKWSAAKRAFAASARISKMYFEPGEYLFGVKLSSDNAEFEVLVNNKSTAPMGFVDSGSRFGQQCTIYAINKFTNKVLKSWEGNLHLDGGIAKQVNAGKSQILKYYAFITADEWAKYKNCKFMMSTAFYPNPEHEPLSHQMSIAYTTDIKESSVAVK